MLAHEFLSDAFNEYSLVWDHKLQLYIQDKLRKRRGCFRNNIALLGQSPHVWGCSHSIFQMTSPSHQVYLLPDAKQTDSNGCCTCVDIRGGLINSFLWLSTEKLSVDFQSSDWIWFWDTFLLFRSLHSNLNSKTKWIRQWTRQSTVSFMSCTLTSVAEEETRMSRQKLKHFLSSRSSSHNLFKTETPGSQS